MTVRFEPFTVGNTGYRVYKTIHTGEENNVGTISVSRVNDIPSVKLHLFQNGLTFDSKELIQIFGKMKDAEGVAKKKVA